MSDKAQGRELLGQGQGLAVSRFRQRLLGGLPIPPGRGRLALDIGCGDGLEAVELLSRGWKVDAVDLAPHPAWARLTQEHKGRLRFRIADDKALQAWRGSYALVFQKDVAHHVPDPVGLFRSLAKLTAPGGELWALECNRRNPVSYVHLTLLGGHQHFTRQRLEQIALDAGMQGAELWQREARVWPVDHAWFQDAVDRFQDLAEALPWWRPLAVYNLLRWRKPAVVRSKR